MNLENMTKEELTNQLLKKCVFIVKGQTNCMIVVEY